MVDNTEQGQVIVTAAPERQPALTLHATRIWWSAIIAGAIVTAGVWLLLHTLGMGVGLTAIDPQRPGSLQGIGIGTGIWSLLVPIVALFVGGLLLASATTMVTRLAAIINAALLWSIATIASLLLMVWLLSSIIGGTVRLGGQVVGTAGAAAVQGIAGLEGGLDALGLDEDDLVAPLNERLRAMDKPTITPEQLRAAVANAVRVSLREGRLDRDILEQSLATNTALQREDVRELANVIEREWQQRAPTMGEVGAQAQAIALEAAQAAGQALLWLFLILALGLGAAVGGALLIVGRRRKSGEPTRVVTTRA